MICRFIPLLKSFVFVFLLVSLSVTQSFAQITWPQGQLLPSFPKPAQTQDLITLRESVPLWQAEGPSLGHGTGRLESDGWLCQTSIDSPNQHMIYGPYDTTIPAGPNVATYRIKTDNNTANNDPIVDIDVRDATTGETLAFQTVTRLQFPIAGDYVNFTLPFTMPAAKHSLELRVFWHGTGYTKVDWVSVQNNSGAELYLFASLKGIINSKQPRIFSYEGDAFAEGPYTWLQSLGLNWTEYTDNWQLLSKYKSEIKGLIVYDPDQIHTVNLATMLAKENKALIASPSLLARLTAAPYNFKVLADMRGKFTSKLQVYKTMFNKYWSKTDHRLLIGLDPNVHKAALREYATAIGAATIWLNPNIPDESALLNRFLSSMPAGANMMGWWPEEQPGIERASFYGIATIASDFCSNLTMHSGTSRSVTPKPIPQKPVLENKLYVAFILSDGDNLQYVEHLMRKLWNDPGRGTVPMGWTVSPSMLDAMPGALNYYWQTVSDNDELLSGPSGYGYSYPNDYPNEASLKRFTSTTNDYTTRAGLRVVTVWNTITGGIARNVGNSYAINAPSLLGLTSQNTGGGLTIFNKSLPSQALSCNYCTGEGAMKDAIASAAAGWDGKKPRFIIIQAQPWTDVKPSNFANVANSLDSNYKVVRPDHLFMLLRESKGLPILPVDSAINDQLSLSVKAIEATNETVTIFPNPASSQLVINGVKETSEAAIYDASGRVIRSRVKLMPGTTTLNIADLKAGTYLLKSTGSKNWVAKFVKIN
ncbi:MAG: T9SS type A sorting domain-containing protein [Williamsia sp.]|nr:T9SS type A sorting domain-containing protein [Williamsia sp.]